MNIKPVGIKKWNRTYAREDGTLWNVLYDADERVWTIWQVDENDEIVYGDPRNEVGEEGHDFEPRLEWALNRIRDNR